MAKSVHSNQKAIRLSIAILAGLILGALFGLIMPDWAEPVTALISTIYLHGLTLMIYPLVFCSLIVGVKGIGSVSATGKVGGQALLYFIGTTLLASLLGLFPPTSDLNIVAGWAILVFILITYYKLQGGLWPYVKGFFTPVPLFAPMNVLGEVATPVSMSFRHYGNVLSGVIISALVGTALKGLSNMLLGWLPGVLGQFPFLQIGLPAILSLYFDIFSGCMQAFIFAMLTMLNIALGFPEEDYERRQAKKRKKASLQKA